MVISGSRSRSHLYLLLTIRTAQIARPKTTVPDARPGTGKFQLGASARQFDALGTISMIPTWLKPLIAIAMLPSGVGIM